MKAWLTEISASRFRTALEFAVGGLGVAILHQQGFLFRGHALTLLTWLFVPLAVWGYWRLRSRDRKTEPAFPPGGGLVIMLLAYLVSSATKDPFFFYLNWLPAEYSFFAGWLERALIFTVLISVFIFFFPRATSWLTGLLLVVFQFAAFKALWNTTNGEPLYRVDHPAFLYRLHEFAQIFPHLVHYDPFWNGGKVASYLVASGIPGPGILLWPLWSSTPITSAYTPGFGILFILITPLLGVLSARLIKLNWTASFGAGLLAIGPSHFFYIHLINYGTIGSMLATAFILPVTAILYRMTCASRPPYAMVPLLIVSGFFFLCWPPSVIMAIPIGFAIACNITRLSGRAWLQLAVSGIVLAVLCLPFALVLLTHSNVGSFVRTTGHVFGVDNLARGWMALLEHTRQMHPLLVFLGLLGVWFLPAKRLRLWFGPIILSGLVIAAWGNEWKAELDLDRIMISTAFVAILPAAAWLHEFSRRGRSTIVCTASIIALLGMGGYTAVKTFHNDGRVHFRTMSNEVRNMTDWLRVNAPPGGRVMFAGAAVHGYSGAKVAALPIFTGHEMMACDYYGFSTKLVEYNYPPKAFRKNGSDRLFEFMDLYNVTDIVTYHDDWKDVFRKHPDHYKEEMSFGRKTIFSVRRDSEMFFLGAGSITASCNQIEVRIDSPQDMVVIKYNWADGLTITDDAKLFPYQADPEVTMIGIKPVHPGRYMIRYEGLY